MHLESCRGKTLKSESLKITNDNFPIKAAVKEHADKYNTCTITERYMYKDKPIQQ